MVRVEATSERDQLTIMNLWGTKLLCTRCAQRHWRVQAENRRELEYALRLIRPAMSLLRANGAAFRVSHARRAGCLPQRAARGSSLRQQPRAPYAGGGAESK